MGSILMEQKKHVELVCTELNSLRDQAKQQEVLLVEAKWESQLINGRLDEASEKIGFYEVEISKLKWQLEVAANQLWEAETERSLLFGIIQHKQNSISAAISQEQEQRKTMQSISASVHELLTGMADFECKAMGNITNNFLRLEMLNQQYRMLVQLANTFKRKELTYKERLERQNSDLQMAEAEVDLLGDEVKIIGVEPFDANVMALSLYRGQRIMLEQVGGFADGAAVKVVGEETFRICRELVDGVVLVSRDAICASIKDMFGEKKKKSTVTTGKMNKVSKVYGETLFLKRGAAEISNREEELQWKEEVIMELENTVAKLRGVVDRLEEVKKREIGKREMGDSLAISTSKNEGENLTGDYRQLRIEHQELQTEPEQQEKEWYADADELIHLQWVNGA